MNAEHASLELDPQRPHVAIAGGGIAGLYAAWKLAEEGRFFPVLMERSTDRWGGRIETVDLDGFIAEIGPMRFQIDVQPKLAKLVADLGIVLDPFAGPLGEPFEWPKYDLAEDERKDTPLQLLRRGVVRMAGKDPDHPDTDAWIKSLTEKDYDRMRRDATLDGQPMWKLGIWNGLSAHISHQAVMKIRDTGTFYHMIPENLNAVEWMVWWLRVFKNADQKLSTVRGGSRRIVDELKRRLERLQSQNRLALWNGCQVTGFAPGSADRVNVTFRRSGRDSTLPFAHLVLALPKAPLEELAGSFPPAVRPLLDSVVGFPMTKVFFVTSKPWWEPEPRPHQRANRMPTREVHYFYRDGSENGMILVYTDRPATEFWAPYVADRDNHDRAEIDKNPELKKPFARYLAKEVQLAAQRARENRPHPLTLTREATVELADRPLDEIARHIEDSVVTYAIRDWSRPPFGAANHCWRPGVQSLDVRDTLRAFGWPGRRRNLHVCGEAYSDYTGFIEGSLRTAEDAIAALRAGSDGEVPIEGAA